MLVWLSWKYFHTINYPSCHNTNIHVQYMSIRATHTHRHSVWHISLLFLLLLLLIFHLSYLDDVPKATSKACRQPLTSFKGLEQVNTVYMIGRVIQECMIRPTITHTMYSPSCSTSSVRLSTSSSFPAMMEAIPTGDVLKGRRNFTEFKKREIHTVYRG